MPTIHDFLHTFPIPITSFCKQKCLLFTILLQYYVGIIYHVCNNVNKKVKTCQYIPLLERKKDRVKNPILIFYNFISYITEDVFSVQRHPVHLNMPVQHQILFCILSVLPGSCDMQLSHMQRLRKM